MKRKILIITGIAATVAALLIVSGVILRNRSTPTPPLDPIQLYQSVIASLPQNTSHSYCVKTLQTATMGTEVLKEASERTITKLYSSSSQLAQLQADETITAGTNTIQISEVQKGNKLYIRLDGNKFVAPFKNNDILQRYSPLILISEGLYLSAETLNTPEGYSVHFMHPTAPESWAMPAGAEFIDAEGTVAVSEDNQLQCFQYIISYRYQGMTVSKTVETTVCDTTEERVIQDSEYLPISDPNIPRLLENACSYILAISSVNTEFDEVIRCDAFGDERKRIISLEIRNEDDWSATLDTTINLMNSGRPGEITQMQQTESVNNGEYQLSIDGKITQPTDGANAETLRSYCRDLLVGSIILPQHIATATLQETESNFILSFTATEELSLLLDADICQMLYDNPAVLDGIATDVIREDTVYTLTLDRYTGLPLHASVDHGSTYIITDIPYTLTYRTEQSYSYPN